MDAHDQELWRALQKLRSVACWLMTGAHPDDEWSGFLAWLAFGRGVNTVYACATRGEGGQNALGPARGRRLGALRSREMEQAARPLDLSLRWLGAGPANGADDPIIDFGFSRSGDDTLKRWGEKRLRDRLVATIRRVRPDAMSPTFLAGPGQHGHHRAITRATLAAMEFAADRKYRVAGSDDAAWRVAKFYLPAFSGAGGSYDDEVPPPTETIGVDLGAHCEPLGASWAALGEASRRWHASQGMGRDLPDGTRWFPLHLARGVADATAPMDGVVHGVAELAATVPAGPIARSLLAVDAAISEALAAFPNNLRVADAAHRALGLLDGLDLPDDAARRMALKRRQLGRVAALALGLRPRLGVNPAYLRAGEPARLMCRAARRTLDWRLPDGWTMEAGWADQGTLAVPADAAPVGTERDGFDPLGGNDLIGARLSWMHNSSRGILDADPRRPITVAPAADVAATPARIVRRLASDTPIVVEISGRAVTYDCAPGRTDFPSTGARLVRIEAGTVREVALLEQADISVLRAEIAIDPSMRVGVIAGDVDETLSWLQQLDINAVAVDDTALRMGPLAPFDVLLVGVLGYEQRAMLRRRRNRIVEWVEAGGSLVTLYQRPRDGWQDGSAPPRKVQIGSPSLRWRVTDPAAPVTVLQPKHRLLGWPNRIVAADWKGWVRERGLYFASVWDDAYAPLLELSDPGEPPLHGGLLVAEIGQGRHIHCALALHHQFTALVPGAFRLLANLVASSGT